MTTVDDVATDDVLHQHVRRFEDDGYTVARGLLGPDAAADLKREFMELHAAGPIPGHFEPTAPPSLLEDDPTVDKLTVYPRVLHPHQVNDLALRYLLDARIGTVVGALLGEEPLAAQSMFYFKPPGARGQAPHQDNFYLRVEPGTCVAAWVAVDDVDRDNGGLEVVPGTHKMDLFCPEEADSDVSFTREYVPPPPGLTSIPVDLAAGDVLFFNGSLVHGSGPNATTDRFRRSFICHYVGRSSERIADWYKPLTMNGEPVAMDESVGGGPCGSDFDVKGPH